MLLCMSPRVLLVTIKAPGLITTPMPMPMPALPSNHTKHRVITCRASKQDNDISQKINTLDAEPLGGLSHPCWLHFLEPLTRCSRYGVVPNRCCRRQFMVHSPPRQSKKEHKSYGGAIPRGKFWVDPLSKLPLLIHIHNASQ